MGQPGHLVVEGRKEGRTEGYYFTKFLDVEWPVRILS